MRKVLYIGISLILVIAFLGCKKSSNYDGTTISNPSIPVTVSNLYGVYTYPTVATSVNAGGQITITLNIPGSSGRSIKEITRVAAGTTGTNYVSVEGTSGLYNTSPIPGNGTSVTFTTTLAEYLSKTKLTSALPVGVAPGAATSFLGRYFFFLLTLDNGQQIIPSAVRVYVQQ